MSLLLLVWDGSQNLLNMLNNQWNCDIILGSSWNYNVGVLLCRQTKFFVCLNSWSRDVPKYLKAKTSVLKKLTGLTSVKYWCKTLSSGRPRSLISRSTKYFTHEQTKGNLQQLPRRAKRISGSASTNNFRSNISRILWSKKIRIPLTSHITENLCFFMNYI